MTDKQEFNSVFGDIAGRDVVHHTSVYIAQQTIIYKYDSAPAAPPQQAAQHFAPPQTKPLNRTQLKLAKKQVLICLLQLIRQDQCK